MPYDTLINALLDEGRAKCEGIIRKAQGEAEQFLDDVKQTSEALEQETDFQIKRALASQCASILSRATLAARHLLLHAKQEVLASVWKEVSDQATSLSGQSRMKVLSELLDETLAALPGQQSHAVIECRERPYFEDILKKRGIPFEEWHQDDLLLGIKLESDGEVLTNSVATRLAKAKPELTIELNRLLFKE